MDPLHLLSVDSILSRPSQVHLVGDKEVQERALGKLWKTLFQAGTLTAAMILQALPGSQAQAFSPHFSGRAALVSVHSSHLSNSGQRRDSEVVLINPLDGKGLDHLMAGNGIEAAELLYAWRHSDITPEQGLELTKVLMATQSPTFVRDDAMRQRIQSLAERTAGIFQVSTRKDAAEFLEQHRIEVLHEQAVIPSAWADAYSHAEASPGAVDMTDSVDLWLDSAMITHGAEHEPLGIWIPKPQTSGEFQQAVSSLQAAVTETGLGSLRVPLSMWSSADTLNRLSEDLIQANLDLQQLTGWDGQVLGLKGQVHMMAGASSRMGLSSFEEGHGLAVAGPLDIAEHEILIHGVGSLLAVESGLETAKGFGYSIGEAVETGKGHLLSKGARTWFELKAGVASDTATWRGRLKDSLESGAHELLTEEYARYAASPEETMAFVLEAIAYEKLGDASPLVHRTDNTRLFVPQAEEAMRSQGRFEAAFLALKGLWWDRLPEAGVRRSVQAGTQADGPLKVEPASLEAWRQARNFLEAEEAGAKASLSARGVPSP